MEKLKYITTIDELQKYIGKVVYLYYTTDGTQNGHVQYAWAKKLTKIQKPIYAKEEDNSIVQIDIYGTYCVVFKDMFLENRPQDKQYIPRFDYAEEQLSNAQRYIRELTITEKLMYRILLKKEERKQKE